MLRIEKVTINTEKVKKKVQKAWIDIFMLQKKEKKLVYFIQRGGDGERETFCLKKESEPTIFFFVCLKLHCTEHCTSQYHSVPRWKRIKICSIIVNYFACFCH